MSESEYVEYDDSDEPVEMTQGELRERIRKERLRVTLDMLDLTDDAAVRRILATSVAMEAADMLAEQRQNRAEYLETFQMLRERGHDFQPDPGLLARMDEAIAQMQEIVDIYLPGEEQS